MIKRNRVKYLVPVSILAALVFVYFLLQSGVTSLGNKKIVDYKENVMQQFLWFYPSGQMSDDEFGSMLKMGDPNRVGIYIFRDFYDNRNVARAERLIEAVIREWNLYETYKLNYKIQHGKLNPGWWSGMEGFAFPMLLVAVSQVAGDDKYLALANKMLDQMLKTPKNGGVMWEAGGCWLSEYAWEGMNEEDEYYVLNGNLFALEALKILADALNRVDLKNAYQCVLQGTKNRASEFLEEGEPWSLYMVHPPTINQVHYVIFEAMQFANLYALTGDIFFERQAELRRRILRERYPIYSIGEEGNERIFFSMMGAPHPYSLDTYGIRIVCESPGREERIFEQFSQFDENKPLENRIFIDEKMNFDQNTVCSVNARSVGMEFLLYKTSNFIKIKNETAPEVLKYDADASLDGYMVGERELIVDPARVSSETQEYLNTQARINYRFESTDLTNDSLLGFELRPDRDLAVGIQLSDGPNSVFRYYPRLKANRKNIILLSKLGFDGGRRLGRVTDAIIFVYTHEQKDKAVVGLGDVLLFNDQSSLQPYFKNNDVYMYTE